MGNIKVSVIVPVYNAEQYIEQCVRSLMEQTMKEGIEFIFVNDCTPDNSMHILEQVVSEYPERVNQVALVNNSVNLGVMETRKKGVEYARGEYIGWCDSDDWCENNMFEEMYKVAYREASDIVVSDYWNLYNGQETRVQMAQSCTPQEAMKMKYLQGNAAFSSFLWHQIVKKHLFIEGWKHVSPVNFGEDFFVLCYIYYYSKTIRFINQPLYNYRSDNEKSLVHLREVTYAAWLKQKKNLEKVESLYYRNDGWNQYHVTINSLLFESKYFYKEAFTSKKVFFFTFNRASRDVLRFYNWKKLSSWKIYMVNNFYFIYKITSYFENLS